MLVIYNRKMDEIVLNECQGFDWDDGNQHKNWEKHQVTHLECEEIFFNAPLILTDDSTHSQMEKRIYGLGQTDKQRKLFVAFTIRNKLIRVISARDMSKKERKIYEKENSCV